MPDFHKPTPILQKNVTFKGKQLTKIAKELLQGNWIDAGAELLQAIGLEKDPPQALAYGLFLEAIMKGLYSLVEDHRDWLETASENIDSIKEVLEVILEFSEDKLTASILENPKQLTIIKKLRPKIIEWGKIYSLNDAQAQIFADKFPRAFNEAFYYLWLQDLSKYNDLYEKLKKIPNRKEFERDIAWRAYHARLESALDEDIFGEDFSIRSVYIPLRSAIKIDDSIGHYNREESKNKDKYKIVDSAEYLKKWLTESDASIKVVSGGPGSGKSTFAKHFAEIAIDQAYQTLFIPLHLINFEKDITVAMAGILRERLAIADLKPFELTENAKRLIIFDGLDEISLTSGRAEQAVTSFVQEVIRKIETIETKNLKILLLGRTRVVQVQQVSLLRKAGTVLELLPYYLDTEDSLRYIDKSKLSIYKDQRDDWWRKYGKIKGLTYKGLPAKLRKSANKELIEITSQPLLNYLLALRFSIGEDSFDPDGNLNKLYEDLIVDVYDRPWGKVQHLEKINKKQYMDMLEHIAMVAWHCGDSRTARMKDVKEKLENKGLENAFITLGEGVEQGAARLLTAFYSRKAGTTIDGDETFEFTHKSFGEYLVAKKIVSTFKTIYRRFTADEDAESEAETLVRWVKVCGPMNVDIYLDSFLDREIALMKQEEAEKWQKVAAKLLAHVIKNHMPVKTAMDKSFKEMKRQDVNAQEALLALHSACAKHSSKPIASDSDFSKKRWQNHARAWLAYLGSSGLGASIFTKCLNSIDFARADLMGADLLGADLSGADLSGADLLGADLSGAYLSGADLMEADLSGANLSGAYLGGAYLSLADLMEADLWGADLSGADLRGADLRGTKNLIIEQLVNVISLYGTDLDENLKAKLEKVAPQLFDKPKWLSDIEDDQN